MAALVAPIVPIHPASSANLNAPSGRENHLKSTTTSAIDGHLKSLPPQAMSDPSSGFLVNSPYTESPHLLDLLTLDTANRLLAMAMLNLKCLREDYATSPYIETFNWQEIVDCVRMATVKSDYHWREQSFYIVAFRSQVLPSCTDASYLDLGALDKAAHAEAMESGGFLKYWFGKPDQNGRNLATCVWRSNLDARQGSRGKDHIRAARAAIRNYSEWSIERLRFVIGEGAKSWSIVPYVD